MTILWAAKSIAMGAVWRMDRGGLGGGWREEGWGGRVGDSFAEPIYRRFSSH